jgi:hypothetical protein
MGESGEYLLREATCACGVVGEEAIGLHVEGEALGSTLRPEAGVPLRWKGIVGTIHLYEGELTGIIL